MCNLYSLTTNQEALRRLFRVERDLTGNLPALAAVFPDQVAPVVRQGEDGRRELLLMRWGFPPPPGAAQRCVTNARVMTSPFWRAWSAPAWRCLVPVSAFCEYTEAKPKVPVWFARDTARSPFAFAGLWRPWTGLRGTKADPAPGEHRLFAFLTTAPNAIVAPIHPKAMPVLLLDDAAQARWLEAPWAEAQSLQAPAPEEAIHLVARGARQDPPEPETGLLARL